MSRHRRALSAILLVATLAAATSLRLTAHADTAQPGTTIVPHPSPIQHVIFIYNENHSFDNIFGKYCAAKPVGHCDGKTGKVTFSNGATYNTQPAQDIVPGVCHEVYCLKQVVNGGKMDGWDKLQTCGPGQLACLQQFNPGQVGVLTWMADHGVLADRFFSEQNPSAGAHMFFFTGEDTLGFTGDLPTVLPPGYTATNSWGCDSNRQGNWLNPATNRLELAFFCNPNEPALPNGGAEGPTPVTAKPDFFTSILDPSGLSWKIYGAAAPLGSEWLWNPLPYQAAALNRDRAKLAPGLQLVKDARDGTLPNVAFGAPFRSPAGDTSQHNTSSMNVGDNWITNVLTAAATGPEAASTAVILTYDDCGCFYDHVAPPPGLGIRVPLLIWSPWAKKGVVDHQNAQFSSVLAFLEHNFGLPSLTALNPTAQDGTVTNDLMDNFDFSQATSAVARQATAAGIPAPRPIPAAEAKWLRAHVHDSDDDDT
jgi:phospholipase C